MGTLRALADTSLFIGLEQGRILRSPSGLALSMISIGELKQGVLHARDTATRAMRLRTLESAQALDPFPVDDRVADAWAELRVALLAAGRRLGINDSWIAATAIVHDLPLVTRDRHTTTSPA